MTNISGWVFIVIGFVMTAVSIFMVDTLKVFIVLGIVMALYGLVKLSFKRMRKFLEPPDIEGEPVHIKEANNPYLAKHNKEIAQRQQQHRQQQQRQYKKAQGAQQRPVGQQHSAYQSRYCHSCGSHIAAHHRFCGYCGKQQ